MRTKVKLTMTINEKIRDQGSALAAKRGLSLSALIEQLLRAELTTGGYLVRLEAETEVQQQKAAANAGRRR